MAKNSNRPNLLVLAIIVVVLALLGYFLLRKRDTPSETPTATSQPSSEATAAPTVATDKIDPANEGRQIAIDGDLVVNTPATDTQLGISTNAIMLLRFVEMLQWQEQCIETNCTYKQVWSPQPIASVKFHQPDSHKNPVRLPLTSARFSSTDVRLGAFRIDAAALGNFRLGSALKTRPTPLPVTSAELPSNLAISFRDFNGALYGGDPAHRQIGDIRVSYRTIAAGRVELTGVQRGERLVVQRSALAPLPAMTGAH